MINTTNNKIMANKTKTAKPRVKGRVPRPKPRKSMNGTAIEDTLDEHAVRAAHMLYDPCGADLAPTVYPGDRGYVSRFSSVFSGAFAAGETVNITVFKVGNNVMWNGSAATSATNIAVGFADTQAPGAGFLNASASKCRAAGACILVRPNASPSTATGTIYYGVVPANAVLNATSVNADSLIPLLTQSVSCSQALMQPLEVKWSPGAFDDRYSPVSGIIGDDDTDRNVIVIVTIGMPATTGLSFRATAIYEWTPAVNSITVDSTSVAPSKCDFSCVLRNLKRKDPDWWWGLGKKTLRFAKTAVAGYYTGGPIGAATAMAKYL